jgi:hypothetical protein
MSINLVTKTMAEVLVSDARDQPRKLLLREGFKFIKDVNDAENSVENRWERSTTCPASVTASIMSPRDSRKIDEILIRRRSWYSRVRNRLQFGNTQ